MISLADFEPLSIAKINIIHQQPDRQTYINVKVPDDGEVPIQTMLHDGATFHGLTSLIGLNYLHPPSNSMLNSLTLTGN